MEVLRSFYRLYLEAARDASIALYRNPVLILGTALSFIVYNFSMRLLSSGGFFGGMVVGLVQLFFISVAYCWLRDAVSNERLVWRGLYQLDGMLFSSIINTGFVLFLAKFVLSIFIQASGHEGLFLVMQLGLVLVCNALPEVLYLGRSDGVEAIKDAAQFTRENWIEWFFPFFLFMIPWLTVSSDILLILLAKMDELLPATVIFQSVKIFSTMFFGSSIFSTILSYLLGLIAFIWFMLFRGFLFKALSVGSRRTRIFLSKQK
jgi:hypothetical protein